MKQLRFKEQVVVTTALLAEKFGASEDALKVNFNSNKIRYTEGLHYFLVKGQELKNLQVSNPYLQISSMTRQLYLWTEKGAFNHVKSLGTDEAWDAFQQLVDTYFKIREIVQAVVMPQIPQTYKEALKTLLEQLELNEQLATVNAHLAPRAEYTEKVLKSHTTYTVTQIANELQISAQCLNKLLIDKGVQYKHRGQYILKAKFLKLGYGSTSTHVFEGSEEKPKTRIQLEWTESGRAYIHKLFDQNLSYQKK